MAETDTITVQAQVPNRLFEEMEALVRDGWFRNVDDVLLQALRCFVESRRPQVMERHVLEDVEWGLRGDE